tara:strand:- start:1780 stop:2517 length:738 start_codon:yes stop_codon:yes gene_type:complete
MSKNRQTVLGWVFILFLLFLWASPAWGTVYKWKDENGSTHFTDDITKVPPEYKPHHTNKKPRAKKETGKPKTSTDQNFKQRGTAFGQGNEDFKEMGDALGRGMEQGMEQLTEGLVKAFQDMGEGLGKFIKIAEANKPDMEKTSFSSKKEEITYKVQQFLLAMFLMCQFQFIVEASKNCSEDGVEITEEKKKEFKDYVSEISPSKNSRTDLLIRGYHKHSGEVWQITHEGKSSIKKSPDQNKKKKI